jgi:hypothetical protein
MDTTDLLFTLLGAWLFALLFKGRDIIALSKTATQRTAEEKKKVKEGLFRALLIEVFLLVPASAVLILIILPFLLKILGYATSVTNLLSQSSELRRGFYALVGILSYNFPFATVREIATRVALNTLREFAELKETREMDASSDKKPIGEGP